MIKRFFPVLMLATAFILGTYRGSVALWQDGKTKPIKVFPYSVSSLPSADQKALARGIRVESEAEILKLIEDYLS